MDDWSKVRAPIWPYGRSKRTASGQWRLRSTSPAKRFTRSPNSRSDRVSARKPPVEADGLSHAARDPGDRSQLSRLLGIHLPSYPFELGSYLRSGASMRQWTNHCDVFVCLSMPMGAWRAALPASAQPRAILERCAGAGLICTTALASPPMRTRNPALTAAWRWEWVTCTAWTETGTE